MSEKFNPFPLFNGSVIAGSRPESWHLTQMGSKVDTVVTLEWETEYPLQTKEACQRFGLEWVWAPIIAVNYNLIVCSEVFEKVRAKVGEVKESLEKGKKIYLHCAAGIHRTGFFLYQLLRVSGMEHELAMEKIEIIRPAIIFRIGAHRVEIARMFYDKTCGNQRKVPYFATLGMKESDFVKPRLNPLFWVKVLFCGDIAKIAFCITSCDFSRIVTGTEVFMQTTEHFSWKDQRTVLQFNDFDLKSAEECALFIKDFVRSCTEKKKKNAKISGTSCFFDKEFLLKFVPEVFNYLHYRIVDLSSFEEICGEQAIQTYSIYEDIERFRNIYKKALKLT